MDRESLYRATLTKWGDAAQLDQAVEECAELITALKHYRRGKIGRAEVIEELADVSLMVGQLRWMFGEDDVDAAIAEKIDKLEGLLGCPGTETEDTDGRS